MLTSVLGSGLINTLYVLDEPTSGMHETDVVRIIRAMRELKDSGNTVVVVEHDLDVIRAADWVIDLGPGGGPEGGELVAEGTPEEIRSCSASLTGRLLAGERACASVEAAATQQTAKSNARHALLDAKVRN